MKVTNELPVVELNGKETQPYGELTMLVESHYCRSNLVVISFGTGNKYTVNASELRRAIDNATHV
jgi:hypothetical protein